MWYVNTETLLGCIGPLFYFHSPSTLCRLAQNRFAAGLGRFVGTQRCQQSQVWSLVAQWSTAKWAILRAVSTTGAKSSCFFSRLTVYINLDCMFICFICCKCIQYLTTVCRVKGFSHFNRHRQEIIGLIFVDCRLFSRLWSIGPLASKYSWTADR